MSKELPENKTKMKKSETGAIGSGIVVLAIVVYGLKAERGWKYWVLAMLFLPWTGFAIGAAFGQEDDINSITGNE